jgi:hypothetical protein
VVQSIHSSRTSLPMVQLFIYYVGTSTKTFFFYAVLHHRAGRYQQARWAANYIIKNHCCYFLLSLIYYNKKKRRRYFCLMVEASDNGYVLHTRRIHVTRYRIRIQQQRRLAILNQFSVLIYAVCHILPSFVSYQGCVVHRRVFGVP